MDEKLQLYSKPSNRYALALFKLALQEKNENSLLNEVDELLLIYEEQKKLEKLFNSPLTSSQNQIDLINSLFSIENNNKIRISRNLYAFLMIVAKNTRLHMLKSILINFKNMVLSKKKELKIHITSVIAIDDSLKNDMIKIFSEKWNTNVSIFNKIDKSILGGLIIRIGSNLIDASIKSKISKINSIMKGVV